MERTVDKTVKVIRQIERHRPDLLEIRFDLMKPSTSCSEMRSATHLPIIATNRPRYEGGAFSGPEATQTRTLMQAAQEGFDYVDLELKTRNVDKLVRQLQRSGARVIVSHHNMKTTPRLSTLESVLRRQKRTRADVCKIVTTARSILDNLSCLEFVNEHACRTKLVCFAMGKLGVMSRLLSPALGAYFTYASSKVGRETASGQLPISRVRAIYKELGIA